jgi:hypothetical protein
MRHVTFTVLLLMQPVAFAAGPSDAQPVGEKRMVCDGTICQEKVLVPLAIPPESLQPKPQPKPNTLSGGKCSYELKNGQWQKQCKQS